MAIRREMTPTDPMRMYNVTHRSYKGELDSEIILSGSYGTRDQDGNYQRDPNLASWTRCVEGDELVELLLFAGVTPEQIGASAAADDLGNLIVANLMQLGPFLDHDDRWLRRPEPTPPEEPIQ